MKIWMIRHGKTEGNLHKRYIGTTDEPLCAAGIEELKKQTPYPRMDALYVSPLLRCRQTADILFPENEQRIVEDFRECDFGEFENKNYMELAGNAAYQQWIDSMGKMPFPGGESREAFQKRCVEAFENLAEEAAAERMQTVGIVAHGGTIMSIMASVASPEGDYYDFQVANGCGYELVSQDKEDRKGFLYRKIENRTYD